MTKLTISFQPDANYAGQVYQFGNINVRLTPDDTFLCPGTYSFFLYTDRLMLLDDADVKFPARRRINKTIKAVLRSPKVWLPGGYFLLVRNSEGNVLRFNISLGGAGRFSVLSGPILCHKMSDEDVLSGSLVKKKTQWKELSQRPGVMQMKHWLIRRAKLNRVAEIRNEMQLGKLKMQDNIVVSCTAPQSVGSTVVMLMQLANIESERKFANLTTFFNATKGNPYEAMTEFFDGIKPSGDIWSCIEDYGKCQTLVFSGLQALREASGKVIMKEIMACIAGANRSVVFYGSRQDTGDMLSQFPSLAQKIPAENRLAYEPFTPDEIIFALFDEVGNANLRLSAAAVEKVCRLLSEAYRQGSTANWDKLFLRNYVEQNLQPRYASGIIARLASGSAERVDLEVQPESIDEAFFLGQTSSFNDAINQLEAMVGLTDIKRSIRILSGQMKFFQERRRLGLRTTEAATYHTILTGNPGTGKTTVAKLLGKICHALGLLSRDSVVFADRSTIVGRYIGETEEIMKRLLEEAKGGVLFIDEAYTLCSRGDERDFGRHAVECLLDVLSQKNPDMMVVFAGYEKEMDALMQMNPGLVGRFPYRFNFPDYTADELMQIAERMLAADQYELTDEARRLLLSAIRDALAGRSKNFGNARWVEQFVRNGLIPALADRITRLPHPMNMALYQRIEADDVRTAAEKFNAQTIELRQKQAIGFCA